MTLAQARTRFDTYLMSGDTTDTVISTTDKDALINEARLEAMALFNTAQYLSPTFSASGSDFLVNTFTLGVQGLVPKVELAEIEDPVASSNFVPLYRSPFLAITKLVSGEGQNGTPRQCGFRLRAHTLATPTTLFQVAVYPIPLVARVYRFLVETLPLELTLTTEDMACDEPLADMMVRLAVARAADVLGYGDEFVTGVLAPCSDHFAQAFAADFHGRLSTPRGLGRKAGVDIEKKPVDGLR